MMIRGAVGVMRGSSQTVLCMTMKAQTMLEQLFYKNPGGPLHNVED